MDETNRRGSDILSRNLVKATGQSGFDFAIENLFLSLGITVERNITFQSKEEQLAFYNAKDISGRAMDAKGINTG